jgi:peptidyl-prolyl cis-trans isomerase B (cyclophilin B)
MKKLLPYIAVLFVFVSCASTSKGPYTKAPARIMIVTDSGTMVLKLYNETPLHRDNFVKLTKKHFFDGLLFHRVIKNFMIQGGDPDSRNAAPGVLLGEGGLKYTVPAEFDSTLFHKRGALAMAREGDDENPTKASSSTQFYIVQGKKYTDAEMDKVEEKMKIRIPENHRQVYRTVGGTPFLDMNYTVFGQLESGFDVVEKIANAPRDKNNRPLHDIQMKIRMIKK